MNNSPIEWCDSTINSVAGCDGCELWASTARGVAGITDMLVRLLGMPESELRRDVTCIAEENENWAKKDLKHGGDWAEWPRDLCLREIPAELREMVA